MSETINRQNQADHLQLKYPGTGHPDTTKLEWMLTQQRDSVSTYLGHHYMLDTMSVAQNQSSTRIKYDLLQKMVTPFPSQESKSL